MVGLRSWLHRFLGQAADRPSAPREPIHVPVSARPRIPVPATPAAESATAAAGTEPWLRERLSLAVRELDAQTIGAERTPAFLTLVGQITGSGESRLRRPPTAAQRAMSACRSENVSVEALVALLEGDPSLSQAILARANSAYYSRGGPPCLKLPDAIMRQGRQSVHSVLLEQTLGSLIYAGTDRWRHMIDRIWSHMVRTAPIARGLAPVFDVEPEQAFAMALLHDVGKLAIFDRMASLRTAQRAEFVLSAPIVSRVLRHLHEPLGGLCAIGWQFGEDAARAIATHHRRPIPAEPDPLTEVIWLAERIDIATAQGQSIDLDVLWREGGLSGDPAPAALLLPELVPLHAGSAV